LRDIESQIKYVENVDIHIMLHMPSQNYPPLTDNSWDMANTSGHAKPILKGLKMAVDLLEWSLAIVKYKHGINLTQVGHQLQPAKQH